MRIHKYGKACALVTALALMLSSAASASSTGYDCDDTIKDYYADRTVLVQAQPDDTTYLGDDTYISYEDTRTAEQIAEEQREAEAAELERLIHETLDAINSGEDYDSAWDNVLDFGDYITDNDGTFEGAIGTTTLPEWYIPSYNTLDPGEDATQYMDINDLWNQFKTEYGLPDDLEIEDLISGGETENKQYDDTFVVKTDDDGDATIVLVDQIVLPAETVLIYTGALRAINPNAPASTYLPDSVTTNVTEDVLEDGDGNGIPSATIIKQQPFDFEYWMDVWEEWIIDQMPVTPGQVSEEVTGQFIYTPDINSVIDILPGMTDLDTIPGIDLEVIVAKDLDALYDLLFTYLNQLYQMGLVNTVATRFTIYQFEDFNINTLHKSVPTSEYRWVVSGDNGSVEKTTNTPYAKLLFRAAGEYDVDIFNVRNVWRSNKVSGTKTEVWVLSNGGYFDGTVVYQSSTSFEGYVTEDIGPSIEEVRMVDDSFTASVSESMLNQIQFIDEYGNIHTAADGFTTERVS